MSLHGRSAPAVCGVRPEVTVTHKTKPGAQTHPSTDDALRRSLTHPEDSSLIEILDRVLDHGIVIEPALRIWLTGLELRKTKKHLVIDWPNSYF